MALVTTVAGPYTGTYSGNAIGLVEDGWRIIKNISKEMVTGDLYGDSVLDGVYRGGNVTIICSGLEYATAIAVAYPYAALGVIGQVGRMDSGSNIAAAIVLTAVAGTTAASSPTSLTSNSVIVTNGYSLELEFASRQRIVPLSLQCYPYNSAGVRWFSVV